METYTRTASSPGHIRIQPPGPRLHIRIRRRDLPPDAGERDPGGRQDQERVQIGPQSKFNFQRICQFCRCTSSKWLQERTNGSKRGPGPRRWRAGCQQARAPGRGCRSYTYTASRPGPRLCTYTAWRHIRIQHRILDIYVYSDLALDYIYVYGVGTWPQMVASEMPAGVRTRKGCRSEGVKPDGKLRSWHYIYVRSMYIYAYTYAAHTYICIYLHIMHVCLQGIGTWLQMVASEMPAGARTRKGCNQKSIVEEFIEFWQQCPQNGSNNAQMAPGMPEQ